MATINFPANPQLNDTYTFLGRTWIYNGIGWVVKPDDITAFVNKGGDTMSGKLTITSGGLSVSGTTSLEAIETSSQTLVDNLNADFLDGQEGAFYRNASNLNAGTLALLYGGTGSTTAAGARTNLGAAALAGSSTQDFSTQNLTVNGTFIATGNVTAPTFIGNLNGNASSATSVIGTVPTNKGGTGLTSIGTAGQVLQVNIGGTGLEWGTVSVSEESRDKGVNNVTTLASLPISKRLVYATITSATSISLSSAMEIGDELHIVVYNSSTCCGYAEYLPNTGAFVSMSNSYIPIPASGYVEINIICHATGSYIIRAGGVSW